MITTVPFLLSGEREADRLIGPDFDRTKLSDEYCSLDEFTGIMPCICIMRRLSEEM